jgi:outer membrane protein assembly factor BamB
MFPRFAFRVWCVVALLAGPAVASEWPGWRGPRCDGTTDEASLPLHWSDTDNVAWKVEVPGVGHSSPIIWGDRVFLTSCREDQEKRVLLCYQRTDGKLLWERTVLITPLEKKHTDNSYASSTPATDGKHVYVTFLNFPRYEVFCYDFDGKEVWHKSPGEFRSVHGFCSPPLVYNDLVILNGDQDAKAFIVALDKNTGEERWRADRPNRTRSYCPPVLFEMAGKKQLVLSGSKCVASYDPDTGKQIWIVDGPTEQFVSSLVYADDVLFLTYGFPKLGVMGIRPDGAGNVTDTKVLYNESKGGGYVPSPIAHGGYFFLVDDKGFASCREGKTGKLEWIERLSKTKCHSSPVSAGAYLYFPDDEGVTHVLKAGPTFQEVAKNPLLEGCVASPAVSHGQLILRTTRHLWCIGKEAPPSRE